MVVTPFQSAIDPDDLMDSGYSSESGGYYLTGCADDILSDIDPHLRIYHKCNSVDYSKIEVNYKSETGDKNCFLKLFCRLKFPSDSSVISTTKLST